MTSINTNLPVHDVDFSDIEKRLITFFNSQEEFKDYDLSASALNILIKMLAHDQHQSSLIAHFASSNWWLDSATNRESIVSLAKSLNGYVPKSSSASRATVDITLSSSDPNFQDSVNLERGTILSGYKDGESLRFIVIDSHTATKTSLGNFIFKNVEIVQGNYHSIEFTKNSRSLEEEFILPDKSIDESFIEVFVQSGPDTSSFERFQKSPSIIDIDENSPIYFRYERNGFSKITFGDGVLGKKVLDGQIVRIIYLTTLEEFGNGISEFSFVRTPNSNPINNSSVNVEVFTVSNSYGGLKPETNEEIKLHAPNHKFHRKRAISSTDYEDIIRREFSEVRSVRVWDNMDSNSRDSGVVFISLNVGEEYVFTKKREIEIRNLLNERTILGMVVIRFVDPKINYVKIDSTINVVESSSFISDGTLSILVSDELLKYSNTDLENFNSDFEVSKITSRIDKLNNSISSSNIRTSLYHEPNIILNIYNPIEIYFDNHVIISSLISSQFTFENKEVFISDSYGDILVYDIIDTQRKNSLRKVGTIDYDKGYINIESIKIQRVSGRFRMSVSTVRENINSSENRLLKIRKEDIKVEIVGDDALRDR